MKVASLFSGCGGLDLGFKNAGFEIVLVNDSWNIALETYRKNNRGSNYKIIDGDVTEKKVSEEIINFSKKQKIDIMIGGPPCQDFSSAGIRNGHGDKANLTPEFAKIAVETKPKWIVMENVNTIASIGEGQLNECKKILYASNYAVTTVILNAADYGIPQNRKRLFLICRLRGKDNEILPFLEEQKLPRKTVKQFMPEISSGHDGTNFFYRHPRSYKRRAIFSVDEASPVIRGVNRPIPKTYHIHPLDATKDLLKVRSLTTEERARIQSFPKTFIVLGNKGERELQIGNAVPPMLGEIIAKSIMAFESRN